jgi:hypothetical protein
MDGDNEVSRFAQAATISAIAARDAKGRVTPRRYPGYQPALLSAGVLALNPSGASHRTGSAQVMSQAGRRVPGASAGTADR